MFVGLQIRSPFHPPSVTRARCRLLGHQIAVKVTVCAGLSLIRTGIPMCDSPYTQSQRTVASQSQSQTEAHMVVIYRPSQRTGTVQIVSSISLL